MSNSSPLPPGWRITNSTGSHAGPSKPPEDDYSDDDSREGEIPDVGLDIQPDSPGWEDMEDDSEQLSIKDFFSDQIFPTALAMLDHCKSAHSFDFLGICKQHNLDFYSTMRLANYVRTEAQSGNSKPDVSDSKLWADDKYLQPALEDDPLLFCLDDIVEFGNDGKEPVDFDERMAMEAAKDQKTELEAVKE